MWSHYADQYTGAVVEFDAGHDFFASQIEVEYRNQRPRRHLSSYVFGMPISFAELCAKSDQWAYEQEVRLVHVLSECAEMGKHLRGLSVFVRPVPIGTIRCVILGVRTPVADQTEIFNIVKGHGCWASRAAVDLAGFSFREERVKFNVPISKMNPMMSPARPA
jgi:hypothetical protein